LPYSDRIGDNGFSRGRDGEDAVPISNFWRWTMGVLLVLMMVIVPTVYYRQTYRYAKRLRTVTLGKVYRSGCLTAAGFRDAIEKYGIKTVINLQDEAPDPAVPDHYFTLQTTLESEVCRSMGAKLVFLPVELVNGREFPRKHAPTIDAFLELMDDPGSYPVLIHCRAGLHRTGVLVALYRQEYEGWSPGEALRELKNHGFGEFVSSAANPYIVQYVLKYETRATRLRKAFTPDGEAVFPLKLQYGSSSFTTLPSDPVQSPPPPPLATPES
jgi:tyrosine-protein phosphatase SIW14